MKGKIKLLYTEDGRMLYSRFFPEVPVIQASANADMLKMARYEREMKEAVRQAIPVENPEHAKAYIAFSYPIEKGNVYEIECEYMFKSSPGGHSIRIINKLLDILEPITE